MRIPTFLLPALLSTFMLGAEGRAVELRVAAWNLEHLDDADGAGCVGRASTDYAALEQQIMQLNADIVAFQEVENILAARRVFPEHLWNIEMSRRPPMARTRACWDKPNSQLGRLATGFAIRRGIQYRRNEDFEALGEAHTFQRWGTDITVIAENQELRLLSVHLRSGCWGSIQDENERNQSACSMLRRQIGHLREWADLRRAAGTAFVILGDFNRRLAVPGDWALHQMSPVSVPVLLTTAGVPSRCDPRFPAFIDHMLAGAGAEGMMVDGSFVEVTQSRSHSDHCAILASFQMGE